MEDLNLDTATPSELSALYYHVCTLRALPNAFLLFFGAFSTSVVSSFPRVHDQTNHIKRTVKYGAQMNTATQNPRLLSRGGQEKCAEKFLISILA